MQVKDMLLAQAIEEKRTETERAVKTFGKLGENPAEA